MLIILPILCYAALLKSPSIMPICYNNAQYLLIMLSVYVFSLVYMFYYHFKTVL